MQDEEILKKGDEIIERYDAVQNISRTPQHIEDRRFDLASLATHIPWFHSALRKAIKNKQIFMASTKMYSNKLEESTEMYQKALTQQGAELYKARQQIEKLEAFYAAFELFYHSIPCDCEDPVLYKQPFQKVLAARRACEEEKRENRD